MKALTTAGLTKLIQLIKSSFISNTDTVTTNTVTLATVATSGSYNDLSNQPTIGNGTITFTQGGVTKGTITANQTGNSTIAFDAGGGGGGAVDSVNGQTGTVVLTASDVGALPDSTTIPTKTSDLSNDSGFITNSALSGYATESWVNNKGYITGITSSDVTTALGYTPYSDANPNGYTSNVGTVTSVNNVSPVSGNVTLSIPTDTNDLTNGAGYITGITSGDVITALGYTPYNSTNPDGYITSSALSSYVDLSSAQNITGTKTFVGQKKVGFKQSSASDKLGFTLYNNSGTEKGYLEYNPSNTVDSVPLMTLGNYASASGGLTHVGFRKYSSISGASGAYNLLAPLISDAKTPFSLTTTYTNFYLPLGFTNGNTTVKAAKSGMVDISTLLPTIPTNVSSFTNDSGYLTSSDFKTINNTSIVGSGDIDTKEIFIAEYGTTTYADVLTAYTAGKTIIAKNGTAIYTLIDYSNSTFTFLAVKESSTLTYLETEHYILTSSGWSTVTGFSTLAPDLSNLSATGKTVIDGQWTSDGTVVIEGLQLHASTNISYPVAVPDDGHKYEAVLSCIGTSTTTSGQATALFIQSSEMTYAQCVYRGTPRSAANVMVGGSIIIPLGTDRQVTFVRSNDYYGTANIYLRGYRRIGSNT